MAIPKFSEIREPALRLLSNSDAIKMRDFITPLAERFKLLDEEINLMYPTGNGYIFYDRISWTLSYLFMAGLVEKPKRGVYRITAQGREMLKTPDKINEYVDKAVAAREPKEKKGEGSETLEIVSQTPRELLSKSYTRIRENVYTEILATILSKTPAEFEKLVVALLQRMGYGGEIKDSGTVTKISKDGGIDGIIKEDILGFGKIHIQAKLHALETKIGRPEIQGFAGALDGAKSNKGVFITTAKFTADAVAYAENTNGSKTIVLINGQELAKHIYDYGLGMQVKDVLEVKELDADYWDGMKDDEKS